MSTLIGLAFFVGLLCSFAATIYFTAIQHPPMSPPPTIDLLSIVLALVILLGDAGGSAAYPPEFAVNARLLRYLAIWLLSAGLVFLAPNNKLALLLVGLVLLILAGFDLLNRYRVRASRPNIDESAVRDRST
jgi:hypothetical protein